MIVSLTISPDRVPITPSQVAKLPVTPDLVLKGVVGYTGTIELDGDPMRFLSEFVYMKAAYEKVLGPFLAYVEISEGTCYLGPHDLEDLAKFNVMLGINIQDEYVFDSPTEAAQPEDSDDGDELRGEDDPGQFPEV